MTKELGGGKIKNHTTSQKTQPKEEHSRRVAVDDITKFKVERPVRSDQHLAHSLVRNHTCRRHLCCLQDRKNWESRFYKNFRPKPKLHPNSKAPKFAPKFAQKIPIFSTSKNYNGYTRGLKSRLSSHRANQ